MKKLLSSLLLLFFFLNVTAQSITGTWYGLLSVPGSKLRIVLHIQSQGEAYTALMDSPDQGANGLAIDELTYRNKEVNFSAAKFGIKYTGSFIAGSNIIKGTFSQGAANLPLIFKRDSLPKTGQIKSIRPQDPISFPYSREEVVIENKQAGVHLAGTLTIPNNKKASKIIVLITGSGPQNRDEELIPFNHRPFLVWSDWFTKQGIAVLRYDDRGVGQSTGDFKNSTTADFADDAEAVVNYIKSRNDCKNLPIGLMGHSEGGMIAPMVASRNKNVSFIILLAGPGVPISRLMIQQTDDQQHLSNTPAAIAALNHESAVELFKYLNENKNMPDGTVRNEIEKKLIAGFARYPAEALKNTPVKNIVEAQTNTYMSAWFRYFISFDPAVYLTKVHCSVLAINGTLDSQVSYEANLTGIKESLTKAGNRNVTIVPLKNLNHLMQEAVTGSVDEYGRIEETINQTALNTVSGWINKLSVQ